VIDFNLSLIENNGGIFAHASAGPSAGPEGSLGQASRTLEPKEIADLERIRQRAETLSQRNPNKSWWGRELGALVAKNPQQDGTERELADLGKDLFKITVKDEAKEVYESTRTAARNGSVLLFLIKMTELSPLQRIPWEILHDGHNFLAKASRTAIVRYFEQVPPVPKLEVNPPLRVLLTSANPPDTSPLALVDEEAAVRLAYAAAGRLVELTVERKICLERLEVLWRQASSRGRPFHVWHHCGHGGQTGGNGKGHFVLCFEKDGTSQPVGVDQLQEVVEFCPELRIAIFNVCRGGATAGVVPALAGINVPVVIGFQHAVHDTSALHFATALHESLLHIPVEFALSLARKSMKIRTPLSYDWTHALAFSRRNDRGLLLRKPVEAVPPQKSSTKKKGRPQGGIRIDVGDIKGKDIDIIGHQSVGGNPSDSLKAPDIRIKAGDIEGSRIRQIGYQQINGFSSAEIKAREAKVKELLERLDNQLGKN
jgi:hypothetical protein